MKTQAFVIAMLIAAPAAAQSHDQRVEISGNVTALTAASKFTESETFPSNVETATLTAAHKVKTAAGFDAGVAFKVVPRLWVGAQYAMADMKPSASITAVVPHPILFNAPRTVQGSTSDVAHRENDVHIDVMYVLPVSALDIRLMAGPSVFSLKQDFVTSVTVNEIYPFDTATFASATTTSLSKTAVGYNAGVDLSRALSPHFAIGALIRYSRANVKFDSTSVTHQTVKAGGLEAGGGIRLRF